MWAFTHGSRSTLIVGKLTLVTVEIILRKWKSISDRCSCYTRSAQLCIARAYANEHTIFRLVSHVEINDFRSLEYDSFLVWKFSTFKQVELKYFFGSEY